MRYRTAKEIANLLGDDDPTPDGKHGVVTYCPVHGEGAGSKRSLGITVENDFLKVRCYADRCDQNEVFKAVVKVAEYEARDPGDKKFRSRHKDLLDKGYKVVKEYAYRRIDGTVYYWMLRYEKPGCAKEVGPKHVNPRTGRASYTLPGDKRRILYNLDQLARRPDEVVHATEGEKDADTLMGLGLLATNLKNHGKTDLSPLRGRHVVVHRDNDTSGHTQAAAFMRDVHGLAASVKLAPDYVVEGHDKTDVTDWLNAGHTMEELLERIARAEDYEAPKEATPGEHPYDGILVTDKQLDALTDETWSKLAAINDADPRLFNFGGDLARVEEGKVEALDVAGVRYELARATSWHRWDARKQQHRATEPPVSLCQNLMATPGGHKRVPTLKRVAKLPIITAEGDVITRRGYDIATGIWVDVTGLDDLAVPEHPTREDAAEALAYVDTELLHDFPFKTSADRTNCLALFLTLLAREVIGDVTPLFLINKPEVGTGASLIVQVLGRVVFGRDVEASVAPSREEEWGKRITSLLRGSANLVWLDNEDHGVNSKNLEAVLTTPMWEDRELGVSRMIQAPNEAVWLMTGNQTTMSLGMVRRSVDVRLDAQMELPEERDASKFRHPNLKGWALEHRAELLAAGLTVIKAWIVAGKPKGNHPGKASFERWALVIGGMLGLAGAADFLANQTSFRERVADKGDNVRQFIVAWWRAFEGKEVLTSKLLELVKGQGEPNEAEGAIDLGLRQADDANMQRQLAHLLKHKLVDRRFNVLDRRDNGEVTLEVSVVEAGEQKRRTLWQLFVHRETVHRPRMSLDETCAATKASFERDGAVG
jgi:hypothetical protein